MAKVNDLKPEQHAEAIRLYLTGLGVSTVALALKCKQQHVYKLIKDAGLMRAHKASANRSYKK